MSKDGKYQLLHALAKNGDTISPTHTCFDDALDLISKWIKTSPQIDWHAKLRLGHGICLKEDGEPYAHAWVEADGKEVWQDGYIGDERISYAVSKEEFYEGYRVQKFTLYTLRALALENLKHGHYGPWVPEYHELTRNPDKRRV